MEKSIFEQLGGTYRKVGKYLLPDINLPQENKPIGAWGRRHLDYLKKSKRALYSQLLISGKLNDHLADIDRQAKEMLQRIIKQMAENEGANEQLKAEDQMEWVRRMNNIRSRAEEVVYSEIIFR